MMTISIWRYSHLALALSSFLLVALASITGVILAFEPVQQKSLPYRVEGFEKLMLSESLPILKQRFEEITELTVDHHQFVVVKGINLDGEDVEVYVDPRTGKSLGIPIPQSEFFKWVTALHRSLFLHELGRFFVGLTAFLLLLITTSGIALIIQRQRGIRRFFKKIVKENFAQYYHVTLGRLLLIPLMIIAISGTYLSLVRFKIIPDYKVSSKVDINSLRSGGSKKISDFSIFKNTPLAQVKSLEFPFSTDVEDYYILKLKDRELAVNQINGDVLYEALYPTSVMLGELSLDLHTGRTNSIWAIILALASANILFFIYSGFVITLKRRSGAIKNRFKKEESKYIILVGSENGSTYHFAKALYMELVTNGEACFITELNQYTVFPKAEHFIVFTATYGLGDAPTNANKFTSLLKAHQQEQKVSFSVVGFGSRAYPDFCKFAFEVDHLLSIQNWAIQILEIHVINDRSPLEFDRWVTQWSQKTAIPLHISKSLVDVKPKRLRSFVVTKKTALSHEQGAFLLQLRPEKRLRFTSGDLLAIYPANDYRERLYSIGKINEDIQLCIKLHAGGLGSSFLYSLELGQTINARVDNNARFHFPKDAPQVVMISNGTGIAPFLGMVNGNRQNASILLYAGFRDRSSFRIYEDGLKDEMEVNKLSELHLAYSREEHKQYVSDFILRDQDRIAAIMRESGVIMICGSLAMEKDVIEILDVVFKEKNNQEVSYYQSHNRILMDCY
ncbi:MAG: PepSY domain-containing protein [Bacteroidia bacterium]